MGRQAQVAPEAAAMSDPIRDNEPTCVCRPSRGHPGAGTLGRASRVRLFQKLSETALRAAMSHRADGTRCQ